MNCKNCKHSADYGESVEWIRCERDKKRDVKKNDHCNKHEFGAVHQYEIVSVSNMERLVKK